MEVSEGNDFEKLSKVSETTLHVLFKRRDA